ncbi:TPA: hypothetical protein U0J99_001097 [Streptococcus suis]|nr:hypothetical protein [Streptococcus suis]
MKSSEIVKLEGKIKSRKFDHIRYELFNQNSLSPFATHIFNKDSKYYVENRDERGELVGNPYIFENFEEAQEKFLGVLSNKVKLSEQYDEQFGFSPYIRRSSKSQLNNKTLYKPKLLYEAVKGFRISNKTRRNKQSASLSDNKKPKVRHSSRERSRKRGPESSFSGGTANFKTITGAMIGYINEASSSQVNQTETHLRRGRGLKKHGVKISSGMRIKKQTSEILVSGAEPIIARNSTTKSAAHISKTHTYSKAGRSGRLRR